MTCQIIVQSWVSLAEASVVIERLSRVPCYCTSTEGGDCRDRDGELWAINPNDEYAETTLFRLSG